MKSITTTQVGKLERLDDISLSLSLYPGPIGILQGRVGQYTNTTLVNIATFIFTVTSASVLIYRLRQKTYTYTNVELVQD